MEIFSKFKKDIDTLKAAANGDFYLDVKNFKLYKKVKRYYESIGVEFSNDPMDDYEILIDNLIYDFENNKKIKVEN
jgi:hypothetical protein